MPDIFTPQAPTRVAVPLIPPTTLQQMPRVPYQIAPSGFGGGGHHGGGGGGGHGGGGGQGR